MKKVLLFSALVAMIIGLSACGGGSSASSDPGVVINGIKWAKCNVDAPGTFAASPESVGMYYKWDQKTGWSSTDPLIGSNGEKWNHSESYAGKWAAENDPSPVGWRVPTPKELQSLLDEEKVTSEWTTQKGVEGRKFTDKTSGKSIFFPVTGGREYYRGELFSESLKMPNKSGVYRSSQVREGGLTFDSEKVLCPVVLSHVEALCIRSVAISENELSEK